jgi:3-methyladenine DNA glycosylase AlkC
MAERLKDLFLTDSSLQELVEALQESYPAFDGKRFLSLVKDDQWLERQLKDRVVHITECLAQTLPPDYEEALDILLQTIPNVKGFEVMAFPHFVGTYGTEHWDRSLDALRFLSDYASGEWAIRPFLIQDSDRALDQMLAWAHDSNEKVRRLASEGCRPRLPWAPALPAFKKNPRPLIPILEALKDDESEFVRRSVANNLNDISKDHPDLALDICEQWYGWSDEADWIVKHACRTLLKTANKRALLLFGYADPANLGVSEFALASKSVKIGETAQFSFLLSVNGKRELKVRLEYAVHFVKARGQLSKKVFKISERNCSPGSHKITRKHSFADRSTRKHYPGTHQITIIVNGEEKGQLPLQVG